MQRRDLVKNIAVGTAASLAASQSAIALTSAQVDNKSLKPAIAWRMPTSWPERQGISFQSVVAFSIASRP